MSRRPDVRAPMCHENWSCANGSIPFWKGVPSGDGFQHASMTLSMQPENESALARHRFLLLFLLLLGTLLLYPYADTSRFGHYAFRVIGSAATLISILGPNPPHPARPRPIGK